MGSRNHLGMQSGSVAERASNEERQELARLLALPEISRSNNLVRLLTFICAKYFEGKSDEIRESLIAIEGFGRKPNFDPQEDSIVRVSASILRKKLAETYRNSAEPRNVQLVLPVGHYVPQFVHRSADFAENKEGQASKDVQATISIRLPEEQGPGIEAGKKPAAWLSPRLVYPWVAAGIVLSALVGFAAGRLTDGFWKSASSPIKPHRFEPSSLIVPDVPAFFFHASDDPAFTDQAGTVWQPLPGCTGGEAFNRQDREILGFREIRLFQEGRSGQFQCKVPVPPGKYELQFLFAQTVNLPEAAHVVQLRINGRIPESVNVTDEAAGQARATSRIVTDVEPETDGSIHIESLTNDSFLNALMILPGVPAHMRPIRFIAAPKPYVDRAGRQWLPDEFVFGGTAEARAFPTIGAPDPGLFTWERYGHFTYMLPVVAGRHYILRLYFSETFFGQNKWYPSGVGSRIFNVYCNGEAILRNFDILREATEGNEAVIKEFRNVSPTAQGKIELSFVPVKDFPSVSAIEVEEDSGKLQ